jgi:glutamyl-Q tRNA(Asp) synthetase
VTSIPAYCGRFAPSPTGPLHFGSLVAAMASWCDARAHGGRWKVRIEDVDTPRSRAGAAEAIVSALERYGFEWDGEIIRQSERTARYVAVLDTLRERGLVYACGCTRKELEHVPLGAGGERIYPGTCRRGIARGTGVSAHAWRMRVADEVVCFVDRLQGPQRQNLHLDSGDFVVKRSDGLFAYQLAVVVDDADQGVTHVVRGADLLASTPRQIWLQRQLGLPTPSYLHHAVAVDVNGAKLSKETGAAALSDAPFPALMRAWLFLGQRAASSPPESVAEFWQWAQHAWDATRLPQVSASPAPALRRAV